MQKTRPHLCPYHMAYHVQILTWFDSPSPLSPFSIHSMTLARKELGKDVGQWFGLSITAGAIKCVKQYALIIRSDVDMSSEPVHNFPEASLGISIAVDGQIFKTDVYTASLPPTGSPRHHKLSEWGRHAVVVLIDFRLGINGVNPIYYDTINVQSLKKLSQCLAAL